MFRSVIENLSNGVANNAVLMVVAMLQHPDLLQYTPQPLYLVSGFAAN
tara:strand:+ start:343 stop:486 length:144 start_codon:yes stop_codon:yes gene_type:complete